MSKKPTLRVVPSYPANPDQLPPNLGEHGAALWRTVMAEYDLQDTGFGAMVEEYPMA